MKELTLRQLTFSKISIYFRCVASLVNCCKKSLRLALKKPHPAHVKELCRSACFFLNLVIPSMPDMLSDITTWVDTSVYDDVEALIKEIILQISALPRDEKTIRNSLERVRELVMLIWKHCHATQGKASRELKASLASRG